MPPKYRTITSLLAGVTLIGALTGCEPDSQGKTDGENNAATPVQAPLPAPPTPPPPPVNAKGEPGIPVNITRPVRPKDTFDDQSAAEFLNYIYAMTDYAILENHPEAMDGLCSPTTDYCQAVVDLIKELEAGEEASRRVALFKNVSLEIYPPDKIADYYMLDEKVVHRGYWQQNGQYYDMGSSGKTKYRFFTLDFINNQWKVRGISDLPDSAVKKSSK